MRIGSPLPLLVLLALGLSACTSTTGGAAGGDAAADPGPPVSSAPKLLGSYQITFGSGGDSRYYIQNQRLDLVRNSRDGIDAYTFDGELHKNKLVISTDRIELSWAESETTFQRLVVRRSGDAALTSVSAELSSDRVLGAPPLGTITATGDIDEDKQAPSISYGFSQTLPWEPIEIGFTEPLLARDITLPSLPGYILALAPYPDTPFMAGFTVRSSTWDISNTNNVSSIPFPAIADPSGNTLRSGGGQIPLPFAAVRPAVAGYDFDKDVPAWMSSGTVKGTTDCEAGSCVRLRNRGASVGFRIAAGKRKVTLRLRGLTSDSASTAKAPLRITLVALSGKSVDLPQLDMAYSALPNPSVGLTSGSAWMDVTADLPEAGQETGITLRVTYPPPRTSPNAPPPASYAALVERVTAE